MSTPARGHPARWAAALIGGVVAALLVLALSSTARAASVEPVLVSGNPTCADLGYDAGFKPPGEKVPGTYTFPGTTKTVTFTTPTGSSINWSSQLPLDAVIVKGGPNANVYVYDPPAEATSDTGLTTPTNPENNQPFGLSHVEFCYDFELEVTKTASTSYTTTYDWTIDKTGKDTLLELSPGQTYVEQYTVKVSKTALDSDFAVDGTISVHNPAPLTATVTGVTDVVSPSLSANVNCGVTFPYTLAAGGTLTCSYSRDLPDASTRTNTATATTSGAVGGDSGTASVDFSSATVTEVDECIDLSDTLAGTLGTVCAGDSTFEFQYTYDIKFDTCGDYTVENTASFVTNDTATTGQDSWSIPVSVPCAPAGCTLTQGYWKTHSDRGPAPYDDGWKAIGPAEEDTAFFISGKTYYEVFWTPPAGNAYYNLAHQYIAATLNKLNGAGTTSDVDAALAAATAFFQAKTPSSSLTRAERNQVLAWASTLDRYNNGLIGPGHCDE